MGLRAGIVAFSGGLKVLAITQGYGLIGLSAVEVLIAFIIGGTFYYIVKKNIPWFGFGATSISKLVSYGKLSGWFMAFTGTKMFLLHSDKILLGYLVGPAYVTQYAITMFTSNALQGFVNAVIMGIIPGIGGLYGRKEFEKVQKARRIIISLNWLLASSLGITILLLNASFIRLWVGQEHYAGSFENLMILFVSVQIIFFQIDSFIINVTLNMKKKVIFSSLASAVTITLAYLLVEKYFIIGLCSSVLIGRFILTIGYPLILKEEMNDTSSIFMRQKIQPFVISIILFLLATYVSPSVSISNWLYLIITGCISVLVSGLIFWYVALGSRDRKEILEVVLAIKLFKRG
jgi:O-antigen/teichoic acid export membrane protein